MTTDQERLSRQADILVVGGGMPGLAAAALAAEEGARVLVLGRWWAAGVNAGGLSNWTNTGGLAPAFITERKAAISALGSLNSASAPR